MQLNHLQPVLELRDGDLSFPSFVTDVTDVTDVDLKMTSGEEDEVRAFLRKLKSSQIDPIENDLPWQLVWNPTTVGELNRQFPSINWNTYVSGATQGKVTVHDDLSLNIFAPTLVEKFLEALSEITPKALQKLQLLVLFTEFSMTMPTHRQLRERVLHSRPAVAFRNRSGESLRVGVQRLTDAQFGCEYL